VKAGTYNLPIIWRGSSYPEIVFTWLDANGNPIDITNWTPLAQSLNIDLSPQIVDPVGGVTSISFSQTETANLKLGVESWDWVFESNDGLTRSTPLLSGTVEVKDPVTNIVGPLPNPPGQ
jgi:hypothetical protein